MFQILKKNVTRDINPTEKKNDTWTTLKKI
jgi:hypothetical protein